MGSLLSEIFDVRSIKLNLDGKTKEPALSELINCIADLHTGCNRLEMLATIREREKKISSGIGNGIAIPRTVCTGIGNMTGAIGVSQYGIDYGAPDNKPVHVIFLLAMRGYTEENYLQIINQIFKLAQSEAYPMIVNAKKAQDIHSILSQTYSNTRRIT